VLVCVCVGVCMTAEQLSLCPGINLGEGVIPYGCSHMAANLSADSPFNLITTNCVNISLKY